MTAPKPGDRVRVTYEGVWDDDRLNMPGIRGLVQQISDSDTRHDFPDYATVEVLAPPPYVNHDATEYWVGDVVRDRRGDIFMRGETPDAALVWTPAVGVEQIEPPDGPLTLLVRDGQVVA